MTNKSAVSGYIFAALAAVCWALLGPISRLPLSHGISPLEVAFWRAFFGACFFIVHALSRGLYKVQKKDALALMSFGVVGVAVFFTVYQIAVQRGGAAMASILLYTAPLWVAVFARFIFKESFSALKVIALVVAMAGVSLVCLSGGGLPEKADITGILCGLLSGLTYSFHYIFGAVYLKRFSSVTMYMYCLPAGALVMLPLINFAPKAAVDWLALVSLGFVSTYLAYLVYCEALKRLQPTRVAVICNLEPLLAAILALFFWSEVFPAGGWIGSALVLAAVFMVMADKKE